MGFKQATPIQASAIPLILSKQDVIACAQTGTGKTGAYLLPIMQQILGLPKRHNSCLILAPTRELAQQIDVQIQALGYFTDISSISIYGGGDGQSYEVQKKALRDGVDIMIATPGRLIAHLNSGIIDLKDLKFLVLDEADRMLDMGFHDDIMKIVGYLPKKRQSLLFSATMPPKIRNLANRLLFNPTQLNIAISKPAEGIDQQVYYVEENQKTPLLLHILNSKLYKRIIVFAGRKEKVKELGRLLAKSKLSVASFHSDLEQSERENIMLDFKNSKLDILIGTDVISRGIDVDGIDLVINYDTPSDPEDYIHRIGRTARAANKGTAVTLVCQKDFRYLLQIEKLIDRNIVPTPLPEQIGISPVLQVKSAGPKKFHKKRFPAKKKPHSAA
ncbi:MAG: DEAD/DEAH box helicase [Pedobacter sp.]|nr:MAG: DEAD/DEAH box helicase [Pedobacter sp.]